MSKGENIFQRKDGHREARCSKGCELPAAPPVRLILRREAARKAAEGVRREKLPAPMFSTGAGRFLQRSEVRDMRMARNGQVFRGLALGGAFPRPSGYIGCSCIGGAEPRPYGVHLALRPFYPRASGLPFSSAAVSSSPR